MKKLIVVLIIITGIHSIGQELPTNPENGFTFPIGSKFTIKMYPIDSVHFNYSIVDFEVYDEILPTWENDSLFSKKENDETIEFYFGIGTHGETEKEREENMKVLLMFKNFTDHSLSYSSDIQREENGEFEETSNVGTYTGAKGTEMWPYMIYTIGLSDFKELE
ncbi:MAG: hypothetical protein H8E34_11010 [Bacteroidetes bacterium]|nr:hypothetical protein [Bacteroidota bacterium]